ncbi:hypothetical protein H2200_002083 [Cladophialophora chaetospira]|uniref:Uncharacterized protein n=1 Tax=Cladophialophora chaetospira TaxID=386627 RepID=A0AA38XI80_9EURO|nr:hypothetical protein H2200_002083 [Cladophialophora chaetospira]
MHSTWVKSAQNQKQDSKLIREQFDDLDTPDGFGSIASGYHGLLFNNLYVFQPTHPDLKGIISKDDLNCAVSKPNALYGSMTTKASPSIEVSNSSQTFSVRSLKIKPLNLPVGFVTISLEGVTSNKSASHLKWSVDFPAGFHDILDVRLEEFSRVVWRKLTKVSVWAVFHYNNMEMDDWEFCIDDLEIEIE